jgi:hypothetical protein
MDQHGPILKVSFLLHQVLQAAAHEATSRSDSNQSSQLQESRGGESNSSESPGEQGRRSETDSHVESQIDSNSPGGSHGENDDETVTEASNSEGQPDF